MNQTTRKLRQWRLPILFTAAGAIGGRLYYRFVGCVTGTCPIAANPYLMPAYGAVIGLLLGYALQPKRRKQDNPPDP